MVIFKYFLFVVIQLMNLTGKSEDVVVIALHDAENDADRAVMMLLEGGDEKVMVSFFCQFQQGFCYVCGQGK